MDCIGDVVTPAPGTDNDEARPLVLVVDDDDEIRELITDYLTNMGYRTRAAACGRDMWDQIDESVDLVILDLMLPGDDGLTLCRHLRHRGDLPVIMISARGVCAERIIGLEIGADDYLCKPFDPRELLARIRAVLRRHGSKQTPAAPSAPPAPETSREVREHCFAGWRLDLQTRRLQAPEGHTLDLTRSDFMVLKALSERPRQIVSRNTLSQRAFGREYYPDDRAIDVCISRLRQMLEDDARRPRLIRTIRNEGYLLELPDATP